MIMNLNELLGKQNVINAIALASGDKELPKELKVKVMRMRMNLNKIKRQYDEDVENFRKEIVTEELANLSTKEDKTEEEKARFEELNSKATSEYVEFVKQQTEKEISDYEDIKFTESEYADIVDINSSSEVEINGWKFKAPEFLELIYNTFVG